jgi:hypothetical protein
VRFCFVGHREQHFGRGSTPQAGACRRISKGNLVKGRDRQETHALDLLISFVFVTALFAMIYKCLPDVRIQWRDVWIGAGLTAFLFTVGKIVIGIYLGTSGVASTYGAAGSLITVRSGFITSR